MFKSAKRGRGLVPDCEDCKNFGDEMGCPDPLLLIDREVGCLECDYYEPKDFTVILRSKGFRASKNHGLLFYRKVKSRVEYVDLRKGTMKCYAYDDDEYVSDHDLDDIIEEIRPHIKEDDLGKGGLGRKIVPTTLNAFV